MNELAYIHPLLVRNPLPPDRLRSSRDRAAAACALANSCFSTVLERPLPALPAVAAHDAGLRRQALAWREALQPALAACLEGVGAFARRQNDALAPLLLAAADASVDVGARNALSEGFGALMAGAAAEQQIARQAAVEADGLRCACARDFMLFVVGADTLRRALPPDGAARAAFDTAVEARTALIGDAVVLASGVIDELGALEAAWGALASHLEQLATQCRAADINSALLLARLQAARAEWSILGDIGHLPPALRERPWQSLLEAAQDQGAAPEAAAPDSRAAPSAILGRLDACCAGISGLPALPLGSAPAALRHIEALQALVRAWPGGSRVALVDALDTQRELSDELGKDTAPRLQGVFDQMVSGQADARAAVRETGMLAIRLAGLAGMLDTAHASLGEQLAQLSGIARDLHDDSALLTGRLSKMHQQIRVLKGSIGALQQRLDAARKRQRWLARLGPLATLMRSETDRIDSQLQTASSELHALRVEQAATLDDAACLQGLLPALMALLAAIDQARADMLAGLEQAQSLQGRISELRQGLQAAPANPRLASSQLRLALASWQGHA